MASIWQDYKNEFSKTNNSLIQLILFNITVFVVGVLLQVFLPPVGGFLYELFQLPSDPNAFIFKPWTLVSYAFLHAGLWHVIGNMIGLYLFGRIITEFLGHSKLISLYFLGAISGGLIFLIIYNVHPDFVLQKATLVGASGAVYAIAVGAAILVPDYRINLMFIGPVKIAIIVAVYIFFSVIGLKGNNAGGNYAHIGGAFLGYLYIKQLQKGNDLGRYVFAVWDFFSNLFKKKSKLKVSHKGASSVKAKGKDKSSQAEIDAILDKISQSGYESLSKEEKRILFSASQKK